jgi:hypothetical protein
VDVDERLPRIGRLEQGVAPRRHLAEATADCEYEIGIAKPTRDPLVHRHAEDADVARRAVVDEVLAAEGARDRELVGLAERLDVPARPGRPAAFADDDERALGAGQELAQPLEILRAWLDTRRLHPRFVLDVGLLGKHVLGQREDDRPRPSGERERICLRDMLGDPLRVVELPGRLGDPPEDLRVVQLLPRLATSERTWHLADEEDHRRRVLLRRMHPDGRLRRTGSARHEAEAGSPRELAVRLCRVRRALLVATRDQPDRRVVERVEDGQVALAREAESQVGAVQLELVDEDLPACSQRGTSSRTVARCSFGRSSSAGSR